MSAHTEGPWRVIHHGGDSYGVQMGRIGGFMLDAHSNPEANARLMAAAPDMLRACRHALDWLASYPGGGASKAYDHVRAALAKAEGKS
jgi:hypothetical protein